MRDIVRTGLKCMGLHPEHQYAYGPDRAHCDRVGCWASKAFVKERTPHEIRMYDQLMTRRRKARQKAALKANLALRPPSAKKAALRANLALRPDKESINDVTPKA